MTRETLARMASQLQHRGPDGTGVTPGRHVGLAHTRLSIIDLAGGTQPLANETGDVLVTFNGEIYNYRELRTELVARGHRFHTSSDTEVLVHGYEEWGPGMLERLNGQFAFAIHDARDESVFLARDRFGVRPLFWTLAGGDLYFASEMKAIFATGEVPAAPSLEGLDEVFTFWGARAPRTPFRDVWQLEPGAWMHWRAGSVRHGRFYDLDFTEPREEPRDAIERLDELMRSSVSFRMRADVPVGGYLSGGLDSSITCALAAGMSPHALRTFSVTFSDPALDESRYQQVVAEQVGSVHVAQHIGSRDVAEVFPEVVRHAETPLVRTAPAPMYLLARLTRQQGIKVVLTGEGSDELFLGYDLFKEAKVREFCARQPDSQVRPRLFDRLYPYLEGSGTGGEFWRRFFLSAGGPGDPLFSHLPRFQLTSRIKSFYAADVRQSLASFDAMGELRDSLPARFGEWSTLNKAAYIEMKTLLASYLLSSQGDRMGMAHGIEGRFPFLDHRLFEFAAALPGSSKLLGLKEKAILKRWAKRVVPPTIGQRSKQPYRAPDVPAFFADGAPEFVRAALDPVEVRRVGLFEPAAVTGLVRRCASGRATGFAENQALVAVLSTQLWHRQFFDGDVAAGSSIDAATARIMTATAATAAPAGLAS